MLARVQHRCIVQLLAACTTPPRLCLIMVGVGVGVGVGVEGAVPPIACLRRARCGEVGWGMERDPATHWWDLAPCLAAHIHNDLLFINRCIVGCTGARNGQHVEPRSYLRTWYNALSPKLQRLGVE